MIVSFSIENFRSFGDRQEFTMLAASREKAHEKRPLNVNGSKLQKLAAIYGPNAAGKSNFVSALSIIKNTFTTRDPITGFHVSNWLRGEEMRNKPTEFELVIYINNNFYNYGFRFDTKAVYEEWLFDLGINGESEINVFQRVTDLNSKTRKTIVDYHYPNEKDSNEEDFHEPSSATFLYSQAFDRSEELFLKHLQVNIETHTDNRILDVINWIRFHLIVITNITTCKVFKNLSDENTLKKYNEILSTMDLDVNETKVNTLDVSQNYSNIDNITDNARISENVSSSGLVLEETIKTGNNKIERHELISTSKDINNKDVLIPVRWRSTGTQRAMFLSPILMNQDTPTVAVIDELDQSLHPDLFIHFVNEYSKKDNENSQLIFTAHNTALLDEEILRSDEVWFIHKKDKQSVWNPLYQYKIRPDLRKGKAYKEGRFESLPNLRNS